MMATADFTALIGEFNACLKTLQGTCAWRRAAAALHPIVQLFTAGRVSSSPAPCRGPGCPAWSPGARACSPVLVHLLCAADDTLGPAEEYATTGDHEGDALQTFVTGACGVMRDIRVRCAVPATRPSARTDQTGVSDPLTDGLVGVWRA